MTNPEECGKLLDSSIIQLKRLLWLTDGLRPCPFLQASTHSPYLFIDPTSCGMFTMPYATPLKSFGGFIHQPFALYQPSPLLLPFHIMEKKKCVLTNCGAPRL